MNVIFIIICDIILGFHMRDLRYRTTSNIIIYCVCVEIFKEFMTILVIL